MDWKVIKQMQEQRRKLFNEANELRAAARKDNRDLTAEEGEKHDKMMADVESMAKQIEREERALALSPSISTESRGMVGRDDMDGSKPNSLDMPEKEFSRFSVLRCIRRTLAGQSLDGVEGEVQAEMERRMGRKAQGFYVPSDLKVQAETRTGVLNATTGTGSVMTTTSSTIIELLRNRIVMNQLGATYLANMQGKFALPRQSGGATAYWVGEGASPTASNQTLDQVVFAPKTVGAYTDISRQFVNQTSIDAENFVRDDLSRQLAIEIDRAAINGSGTSNQPTGILNTSGIGSVAVGTNGGVPTWANVVKLETLVSAANADIGRLGYLTNASVRGLFKATDKTSGYGRYFWDDDNTVNGYNVGVTNSVPSNLTKGSSSGDCSALIFGNFADLVIATWGGLDITVDPFTGSSSGTVRVVALQDVDIELRHAASFAACLDITA